MIPVQSVAFIIFLLTMNGPSFGSWRDCNDNDMPCIQFKKKLCVCTLFLNPKTNKNIHQYVCDDIYSVPQWVQETWPCPMPGVGQPTGKVWRTFLDPTLMGLKRLRHRLVDDVESLKRATIIQRLKGVTPAIPSW